MRLYRYMNREHVADFLQDGKLMLSSYARCRAHEDARVDRREGKANFMIQGTRGALAGVFGAGRRTYILSTSRMLSPALFAKFDANACVVVRRPARFAHAIAVEIGRQTRSPVVVSMQDCIYSDDGLSIDSECDLLGFPGGLIPSSGVDPAAVLKQAKRAIAQRVERSFGNAALFTKRASGYADECEFRFAWTVGEDVDDYLPLVCPSAVEFCEEGSLQDLR